MPSFSRIKSFRSKRTRDKKNVVWTGVFSSPHVYHDTFKSPSGDDSVGTLDTVLDDPAPHFEDEEKHHYHKQQQRKTHEFIKSTCLHPITKAVWATIVLFRLTNNYNILRVIPMIVIVATFSSTSSWIGYVADSRGLKLLHTKLKHCHKMVQDQLDMSARGGAWRRRAEVSGLMGAYVSTMFANSFWQSTRKKINARVIEDCRQSTLRFVHRSDE